MKTINEELNKMKHLFEFKKGDVLTEGEDKECDCGNDPCNCGDNDNLGEMKLNSNMGWATDDDNQTNISEDSEGEETFNYGEDEGEDHKEEDHLEDEEDMAPHDRIKAIKKHLEALESDMSFDEDREDRDEEGTDFSESKKYGILLKTLSESEVKTLKRFIK
jgi:hypothetical protein